MIAYSNQQTKNGQFKKIKFLTIIRLNSNGGQFYKKNYKIWLFQKNENFSVL